MKTILRLVALVVAVASVALLAPGLASANKGRINDRRDARTPLDIASVSYGHAGAKLVHTLRTYKPFASKLLKGSNGIHFRLDVNNDSKAERMVVVVWTGHALRANLIDEHGSLIGRVPVSRPDLRTVKIKLARSAVDNGPIYRWTAATLFKSKTTCRKGCVDTAPNRGFLKHPLHYTLYVNVVGDGDDRVTSSPGGIGCRASDSTSANCSADFKPGTTVTLTATPGYWSRTFMGWSGACTGTGTCRVKLTHDASVKATFTGTNQLTVSATGPGTVSLVPPDILCSEGSECTFRYPYNTTVTLTAMPGPSSRFDGWSGACTGINPVCILMMVWGDQSVSAGFSPISP